MIKYTRHSPLAGSEANQHLNQNIVFMPTLFIIAGKCAPEKQFILSAMDLQVFHCICLLSNTDPDASVYS